MSTADADPRWQGFQADFLKAAALVPAIDPNPEAGATFAQLLGDGNHPLALIVATEPVHFSDGREAALELAALLLPRARLMLDYPNEREFQALEPDEAIPAYHEIIRRLQSVIDAHQAGKAVPAEFRDEVERWWNDQIAGGDIDPAIAAAQARLANPEGGDLERFWLHEILLDWLYVDDQWRWQPALVLLARDRVTRAAPEMRSAAGYAVDAKAPFADTFRRYADELEAAASA